MRNIVLTLITLLAITMLSCGHSEIGSSLAGQTDESILPPSFALSSDFPADIIIPNIDGMKSTAFIVSTSTPAAVIAVDIDKNPMELSGDFEGLISPDGSGIPARLVISATDEAFLLTSNSLIYFNPVSGYVYYNTSATRPVDIGSGHLNSDGSTADSTITPSFPSGMTRLGDKLFIATANYISTENPAYAAPGTIQVFEIQGGQLLERITTFVTSAYNPTGLSIRSESQLIITNTGVLDIIDARGVPKTKSVIDIVDPDTYEIKASIDMGMAGLSFHPIALTYDDSIGFIGSHAYSQVYEIDFINRRIVRGLDDPIAVTSRNSDYITDIDLSVDNTYMYAASFETSTVYPFDLTDVTDPAIGNGLVVGYESGVTPENPTGANTGAGPIAVRPGSRGTDYEGADLFILTGYPGTLVPAISDSPAQDYLPDVSVEEDDVDAPPPPPEGDEGEACQGYAQAVYSVSFGDSAGFGQDSLPDVVLGPPHGKGAGSGSFNVLSLGKQGQIVLDLSNCPAVDGDGEDFIVFENAFLIGGDPEAPFAELAAVGVSDDGVNFTEFDCKSDAYPYTGCAGWHPVYSHPDNDISPFDVDEAGGDAFDLAEIGIDEARYIRIRDINGTGGGEVAGFDLDAVSVINGEIRE